LLLRTGAQAINAMDHLVESLACRLRHRDRGFRTAETGDAPRFHAFQLGRRLPDPFRISAGEAIGKRYNTRVEP
jgi:hypothetical protein